MTNDRVFDKCAGYQIKVLGRLDQTWSDWFDGLTIQCLGDETLLNGPVQDQAALLGILKNIFNLGLTLLWVERGSEVD